MTEALVKSVKNALNAAIGDQIMRFSELQTVMFDAAQIINQRPIGRHPTSPEDAIYVLMISFSADHRPMSCRAHSKKEPARNSVLTTCNKW